MIPFLQIHQTHYLQTQYLVIAMLMLVGILLCVVLFMLVYLIHRKKRTKRKSQWRQNIDLLLRRAIFFEEEQGNLLIPISPKIRKWLIKPTFRQFLVDELIIAKKSFSGSASENLRKLYNQLNLEKASLEKLNSPKWHIKARGIQELALMDQKDKVGRIYRLTNNRNEFVRMEAQSAIVHFYGFEGLRFLDVVSQPISEWQQIKLLAQLPKVSAVLLDGMEGWLKSPNDSVILFSLKLVSIHHRFELHDRVAACLEHPHPSIRIQAVKCLQDICNESTAEVITRYYTQNGRSYQAAVLEVLQWIGTLQNVEFLEKALLSEDDALKLAAARALARLSGDGVQLLDSFKQAGDYPWNEIIRQAKSEKAA